jgi:hypothetical protein
LAEFNGRARREECFPGTIRHLVAKNQEVSDVNHSFSVRAAGCSVYQPSTLHHQPTKIP